MENSSNLLQNFEYLLSRMTDLKHIGDQVATREGRDKGNASSESIPVHSNKLKPKQFSYEDLINFTSDSNKVGAGGYSKVYKGQLDGKQVAIKVLENDVSNSFTAEMQTMVTAFHPNLVTLHGYCSEPNMKALVYEFMEHGSLDKILFDDHPVKLEWDELYRIALETAIGLEYLHNGCGKKIFHRDIKPANVLIDENLSAKITDFGVAKLLSKNADHYTMTNNQGTHGYIAPEFKDPTSHITNKCDVYSFGVMLFEVLAKRRNGKFGSTWYPIQIWNKFDEGQLDELIDSFGIPKIHKGKAKILSMVAFWCSQYTVKIRPSMSTVVKVLEKEISVLSTPPYPFKEYSPPPDTSMLPSEASLVIPESSAIFQLGNLVEDYGYLRTRMDDLKYQVKGRRQSDMDGWLQKVKDREDEVDKLREELHELNRSNFPKSRSKHYLNMKVLENLRVVERLKEEFNAGSESVNASFVKHAKRYSSGKIKRFISTFSNSKLSGDDEDIYTGQFDGKQVAVKVLPEESVIDEIFITEVNTIARASHRYVLKLYGFCFEGNMRALVYEYMKNGPFDKILYENHLNLEWENLYEIAIKTAKGILYLHQGCGVHQIIHHDIRAHNVLLDKNLTPRVTGFGLAKLLMGDVTDRTWTRTRGIAGYSAPEMWLPSSRITAKSDVYSFGILLFEILGKRSNGNGRNWFPKQVWEKFKDGQLDQIIRDCEIVKKDHDKATVLTTLALWCIQKTSWIRPSMSDVVMVLENQILVNTAPDPFQDHPLDGCMMTPLPSPVIPRVFSSTIHESFPERAEEFVSSSSSAPPLKITSSDHLNNTDNSGTSIPRSGKAMEILKQYPRKCPPGGENSVICYTTTSEKPKRLFTESNDVRSILQSHQIKMIERDICGDGNYDEELDDLMEGTSIPAVFVKGRYIGGASEVKTLEEEGKLKMLFDGI